MPSRFFPFAEPEKHTVALIAGKYRYPQIMAERLRALGVKLRLIAFEGETAAELVDSFPETERKLIKVGQLGKMLKAIKHFEASASVMAGQITPGRLFKGLHPDLKALGILASLKEKNAESIFGAIAGECEKIGAPLLDARVCMDEDLASKGVMNQVKWKLDDDHLAHGIRMAKSVAAEDIGQGVVTSKGTVLAVEAFEGTDAMLRRAGSFGAKACLFVKTVKPKQDYRFDVPIFGIQTLEVMHEAGIKAAALEADNVIMLDKEALIQKANQLKISLIGY